MSDYKALQVYYRLDPTQDYDPEFMLQGDDGPAQDVRPRAGSDATDYGALIYQTPDGSGNNPLVSWNGVIDEINKRFWEPHAEFPFKVATDTVPEDERPFEYARVKAKHVLTRMDMLRARDLIRVLNAHTIFKPLPRIWSKAALVDLLKKRWVHQHWEQTLFGVTTTFDTVTEFPWFVVARGMIHAEYVIDMENGFGPMGYVVLNHDSSGPAISPEALLERWMLEDTFPGSKPKPRGKVIEISLRPSTSEFDAGSFSFEAGVGPLSGGVLEPSGGSDDGEGHDPGS